MKHVTHGRLLTVALVLFALLAALSLSARAQEDERVDPRFGVHTGNKIDVVFDMGNVHLFDKATELAIR